MRYRPRAANIMLNIGDDIPNAVVVINTPDTLVLDETRPVGTETDGDSAPAGLDTVTANFADNFGPVPNFGSDGPGSATYSLVLTGTNVASGLFALDAADTTAGDLDGIGQGAQIVLNQAGNTITGSAGGTNYFTITLNPATGQVTFTQLNNIWHASTASDDDTATLTLANANLLTLVQTVTDADGDVDTAAINLGTGVFQIEDDGPDAVVANAVVAAIVLDETRPVGTETDGDSAPAGLDTVTVNLAGNFAAVTDFGSDGPGSATYSLVLTGTNVASGLFALDAADTTAGDLDGIGQGAQIVAQPVRQHHHRLGGRHQLLHDHAEPGDRSGDVHAAQQHLARQHRQRRRHRHADLGERQPADAGADGDRCRRRR